MVQAKLLYAKSTTQCALLWVPAIPFPIQLSADIPEKALEDGPNI